jgi:UDP-glucose 4-epimerase
MSKVIFITGCAGMVGSNLAHYLIENTDYKVVGIDDLSGGYIHNLPSEGDRFTFYRLDICGEYLHRAFSHWKPDIVYHCAAYAAEGLSPFIRKFNYHNNVIGTAAVVNNCIEYSVERLVFFSSIAVYGDAVPPFRETYTPQPIDPYGIAKYACELDIKAAGEQHGLDWVVVRPFNLYGERQNIWDQYRNVLGIWMYNFLYDKPIQIYGDGKQTRNFTYIYDIMPALLDLGEDPRYSREILNLGGDKTYTLNDAAKIFQHVIGKCEIEYLPSRHEVKWANPNTSKCEELMSFAPTSLSIGLKMMWEWVREQKAPEEGRRKMVPEITVGLYDHWK